MNRLLREAKRKMLQREFLQAAKLVDDLGWSPHHPIAENGSVGLSAALALICGANPASLSNVPLMYRRRFKVAKLILRKTVNENVVESTEDAVAALNAIAELIETH